MQRLALCAGIASGTLSCIYEKGLNAMQVKPMAAPMGAVVSGVDIRSTDADRWQEYNTLLCEHHVLVFPDQQLSNDDHIAFASLWGDLIPFPYGSLPGYPNIIALKNKGKRKDVNQHWHSDMTYNVQPPKLTMLYALEAPAIGGETAFANQHMAYEELSDGMKQVVDSLQAHHSAQALARLYGEDEAKASRALHPVVRRHDESESKALYVCQAFTRRFEGWTREESKWLLEYLYKHCVREEFQARHQWRVGDLVIWDNRSVLHYAVHDHGDDPRLIHRCQVEGVQPRGASD